MITLAKYIKINAFCMVVAASLLIFLFRINIAHAITCSTNTTSGLAYQTGTLSGIAPPSFSPGNYAVGDVIYSKAGTVKMTNFSGSSPTYKCDTNWIWYNVGLTSPSNNIYPTSVNGVGLRIKEAQYWPYLSSGLHNANTEISFYTNYDITVELVKTANITAGGVLSGVMGGSRANTETGPWLIQISWASPVLIQPKVPTCTVSTPSITVPLLTPSTSTFKGVGTTFGARPFQLGLTCSGGDNGTSTNTYITFTDLNQPGNTSTTLSLASEAGSAGGLGLQILNGGKPIGYGPDSSAAGNTNQWKVANIAQGVSSYSIPLSVRYIQTGNSVTPGTVTGRATFTMSYQ
jgi:type 1 fimbria pilin